MSKVYLDYCEGVPRLVCTDCGGCNSVMGTSLNSIKARGCCSYFPNSIWLKFTGLQSFPEAGKFLIKYLRIPERKYAITIFMRKVTLKNRHMKNISQKVS